MSELTELDRETKTRPPKRWRNWYLVLEAFTSGSGRHYEPGKHPGAYVWPSKEIAEEKGLKSCGDRDYVKYLGAEPEGEDGGRA